MICQGCLQDLDGVGDRDVADWYLDERPCEFCAAPTVFSPDDRICTSCLDALREAVATGAEPGRDFAAVAFDRTTLNCNFCNDRDADRARYFRRRGRTMCSTCLEELCRRPGTPTEGVARSFAQARAALVAVICAEDATVRDIERAGTALARTAPGDPTEDEIAAVFAAAQRSVHRPDLVVARLRWLASGRYRVDNFFTIAVRLAAEALGAGDPTLLQALLHNRLLPVCDARHYGPSTRDFQDLVDRQQAEEIRAIAARGSVARRFEPEVPVRVMGQTTGDEPVATGLRELDELVGGLPGAGTTVVVAPSPALALEFGVRLAVSRALLAVKETGADADPTLFFTYPNSLADAEGLLRRLVGPEQPGDDDGAPGFPVRLLPLWAGGGLGVEADLGSPAARFLHAQDAVLGQSGLAPGLVITDHLRDPREVPRVGRGSGAVVALTHPARSGLWDTELMVMTLQHWRRFANLAMALISDESGGWLLAVQRPEDAQPTVMRTTFMEG